MNRRVKYAIFREIKLRASSVDKIPKTSISKSKYYMKMHRPQPDKNKKIEHRVEKLIKIFSRIDCETFLDIGCSDNQIVVAISKAMGSQEVFGVDVSANALKDAARSRLTTVKQLVEKVGILIGDRSLRKRMGKAAIWEVEAGRFSIIRSNKKLKRILDKALS